MKRIERDLMWLGMDKRTLLLLAREMEAEREKAGKK